jgi:hypothetical protein
MTKYNKYGAAHKNPMHKLLIDAGMTDLQMIGCFYNNEGDDGIGLSQFDPEGAQLTLDTCVNIHKNAMNIIQAGGLTIEQYKADMLEQLNNELIPFLKNSTNKNSTEYYQAQALTYCDIYALEQLGVIPSDEYNGMNYAYAKGNVLATAK